MATRAGRTGSAKHPIRGIEARGTATFRRMGDANIIVISAVLRRYVPHCSLSHNPQETSHYVSSDATSFDQLEAGLRSHLTTLRVDAIRVERL